MIQRSTSDGSSSPSSTMWRFGGLKNKFRSNDESKTSVRPPFATLASVLPLSPWESRRRIVGEAFVPG